jgi:regulator of sigma E protease
MSLIWFLIIIGVSVFVHELGHYLAARVQGVRVKAFSVGFGPVLWRKRAWDTEWRLSAIPLGGYADIEGLLPEERGRGYDALPFLGKLFVLVAGVLMNVLLAWVLLAYLFSAQGVPEATGRAVILEVLPGSVAEEAGLKPGDVLVAVDGKPLRRPQEIEAVKVPGPHTLTVLREGREVALSLTWREGMEKLGASSRAWPWRRAAPWPLGRRWCGPWWGGLLACFRGTPIAAWWGPWASWPRRAGRPRRGFSAW